MIIAVYGTLRRGFGNYSYLLADQHFIGEEIISLPFKMVSLGGFPALIPSEENNDIVIEVFDIDDEAFRGVDALEGYPAFYNRTQVETSHGKAWIYFITDTDGYYDERDLVPNGDWKQFVTNKYQIKNAVLSQGEV